VTRGKSREAGNKMKKIKPPGKSWGKHTVRPLQGKKGVKGVLTGSLACTKKTACKEGLRTSVAEKKNGKGGPRTRLRCSDSGKKE